LDSDMLALSGLPSVVGGVQRQGRAEVSFMAEVDGLAALLIAPHSHRSRLSTAGAGLFLFGSSVHSVQSRPGPVIVPMHLI